MPAIHGLLSCSEWTGVKLSTLLDEAGVEPSARWMIAEGADAAGMSRSVPLAKAMDDALICLYQNGEHVRPSNGYPRAAAAARLRRQHEREMAAPAQAHRRADDDQGRDLEVHGPAQGRESLAVRVPARGEVGHHPPLAPASPCKGPGFYEISGLAWSGNGSIRQVEVSADGGQSWAPAALSGPILPKAPVRFRTPWQWNGGPAVLQSRATDDTGMVQPSRATFIAERGLRGQYHFNAIQSWRIDEKGEAANVYA